MRGSPLLLSLVESQRLHNKVMVSHLAPRDSDNDRQLFSCQIRSESQEEKSIHEQQQQKYTLVTSQARRRD